MHPRSSSVLPAPHTPRCPQFSCLSCHPHPRLRSRSSAVKLGSESEADMRHISFARLSIADSHRALAIQLR